MALQEGTIVWLKTGGPAMTVKFKTVSDEWLCTWFVKEEVKEHSFMAGQLTEEEPED